MICAAVLCAALAPGAHAWAGANKLAAEYAYSLALLELAPKACQYPGPLAERARRLRESLLSEKNLRDELGSDAEGFRETYAEALSKAKARTDDGKKMPASGQCSQFAFAANASPESFAQPQAGALENMGFMASAIRNCRMLRSSSEELEAEIFALASSPAFDKSDLERQQILDAAENFAKSYDSAMFSRLGKLSLCPLAEAWRPRQAPEGARIHPYALAVALADKLADACPSLPSADKRALRDFAAAESKKTEFAEKMRVADFARKPFSQDIQAAASGLAKSRNETLCRSAMALAGEWNFAKKLSR